LQSLPWRRSRIRLQNCVDRRSRRQETNPSFDVADNAFSVFCVVDLVHGQAAVSDFLRFGFFKDNGARRLWAAFSTDVSGRHLSRLG
jgi:hypothetical protein